MNVYRSITRAKSLGGSLLLGTFDGLHSGHQSLIKNSCSPRTLISFYPHPKKVLRGTANLKRLSSVRENVQILSSIGVDQWHMMHFTKKLSLMPADEFLSLLISTYHPKEIVVGPDAKIGKGGSGDVAFMRTYLDKHGVQLKVGEFVTEKGKKIGSAPIRDAIQKGEVRIAKSLLGREYQLEGRIVHGAGRGKGLGVPTANVDAVRMLVPANGVYVTDIKIRGKTEWLRSVTNIGIRPTFNENKLSIETHILEGGLQEIYGKWVTVRFLARIRDEKKFTSVEKLKLQIAKDCIEAKSYVNV